MVVGGEVAFLAVRRRMRPECSRSNEERLEAWTRHLLKKHRSAIAAYVLGTARTTSSASFELPDVIVQTLTQGRIDAVPVSPAEIAQEFGLERSFTAGLARVLGQRHPQIQAYARPANRYRSESTRYWEVAIVAAAACFSLRSLLSKPVSAPGRARNAPSSVARKAPNSEP